MGYAIVNFYKFVPIEKPKDLALLWKGECQRLGLVGTILLAPEGFNCALAGAKLALEEFIAFLRGESHFQFHNEKWSETPEIPFKRLKVKTKRWIIRFAEGDDPSVSQITGGSRLSPRAVAELIRSQSKDVVVVDTRNQYEADAGMFEGAVRLPIRTFTEFPEAFLSTFADQKDKTYLFYCTGGVRCEKVVPWAKERGFAHATQLDGGILKYFEECGKEGYKGDCFVFDERIQVDSDLRASRPVASEAVPGEI